MSIVQRWVILPSILVLLLVLSLTATALADIGDVSIGGVWVCRLTKGAGGLTLEQRLQQIERNIYRVVNSPRYIQRGSVPVSTRPAGQAVAIMVEDQVIFVVTPDDVAGTGAKPVEAARQWSQLLAKGLNQALPRASNPSGL